MRVPLEWLADYVDIDLPAEELADRLTMTGLKVEKIERIGADWGDIVIGEVVSIEPHPTSNKPLHVADVNIGDGHLTLVTGAQNVRQGDRVPVILVGGTVPNGPDGKPFVIEPRSMAGIVSEGMMASAAELGISAEASGIYILPADAPVGERLSSYMGGIVLDIETNPNRPDTLSIVGIAREVAAITGQQLTLPNVEAITDGVEWVDDPSIPVRIDATDLCSQYTALRIEGVRADESPAWLARRLEHAGMRAINLLVDITNYVMLELGQPMHAFDAQHLQGGEIVVRRAHEEEHLRTLDGVDRVLGPNNLVIADGERAVAIAGVMGGENSEIGESSTRMVLESATFDPVSVRRTAQALNLRSEASSRFEKGLPPEQTVPAALRYLQLLAQLSEAPLRAYRLSDARSAVPEPRTVAMPLSDLRRLLGITVDADEAADALSLLGFNVALEDGFIRAEVPYWRRIDVAESADLVEEVARIVGFDRIPSTLPLHTMPPDPLPADVFWNNELRARLRAAGLSEVVTDTLTSEAVMARLLARDEEQRDWERVVVNRAGVYAREALIQPLHLLNPLSKDRAVMRLSVLPTLLGVVSRNLRHTDERLAFFESARTYFPRPQDLPYERRTLAVAMSGRRSPRTWQSPDADPYTFYDVKGVVEAVLRTLQIEGWEVEPAHHPALHPGRSAAVRLKGHDVVRFGELHPLVAAAFEIEHWPVQVAEIDLDTLVENASDSHGFVPLPRFPAARRDIAVVLDRRVPAEDVLRIIRAGGEDILESAQIFDVYEGAPLPPNHKSIAVGMDFRAPGATLTQEEVAEVMDRIVGALEKELGAELRA